MLFSHILGGKQSFNLVLYYFLSFRFAKHMHKYIQESIYNMIFFKPINKDKFGEQKGI